MGTCDGGIPLLEIETQKENHLETSLNGIHHDVSVVERDVDDQDDDRTQNQESPTMEETAIVEQFQSLELQPTENIVEEGKSINYPLRHNAADCSFYLKTGTCKYGLNCRFNHPALRVFRPLEEKKEKEKSIVEDFNGVTPDTVKTECKYFSTPGGCKYGVDCKYFHSEKIENVDPELNFLGLPIRPMEKECTFFMRTGTCAYGAKCRFNHPDPTAANEPELGKSLDNGYSLRGHDTMIPSHSSGALPGSSSKGTNSQSPSPHTFNTNTYHRRTAQKHAWSQSKGSMSSKKPSPAHEISNPSKKTNPSTHYKRLIQIEEFPERPGEPDCDYFMKTGDCKYRSSCRYNHPISHSSRLRLPTPLSKGLRARSAKVSPVETMELHEPNVGNERKNGTHSDNHQKMQNGGFPERPGMPECEYFVKTGNCKFKSACRYHHPRSRVPKPVPCDLNENGLPLRPGAKVCQNYERQGTCQYGLKCLFHHPDNATSASPVPAEDLDRSSFNVAVATDFEPPAQNNATSDWGDGWVI